MKPEVIVLCLTINRIFWSVPECSGASAGETDVFTNQASTEAEKDARSLNITLYEIRFQRRRRGYSRLFQVSLQQCPKGWEKKSSQPVLRTAQHLTFSTCISFVANQGQ